MKTILEDQNLKIVINPIIFKKINLTLVKIILLKEIILKKEMILKVMKIVIQDQMINLEIILINQKEDFLQIILLKKAIMKKIQNIIK